MLWSFEPRLEFVGSKFWRAEVCGLNLAKDAEVGRDFDYATKPTAVFNKSTGLEAKFLGVET